MENDQEDSNNLDKKIGIRKRIMDKFKTITAETKAIKARIMYLLFYRTSFLSTCECYGSLFIQISVFTAKKMIFN